MASAYETSLTTAVSVSGLAVSPYVASAPRRTRTYNPLIKSQQAGYPKGLLPKDLREPAPGVAHYLPTDTRKTDPDLVAVIAAWPDLPEALKAGIVAMVKASSPER